MRCPDKLSPLLHVDGVHVIVDKSGERSSYVPVSSTRNRCVRRMKVVASRERPQICEDLVLNVFRVSGVEFGALVDSKEKELVGGQNSLVLRFVLQTSGEGTANTRNERHVP